MLITYNYRPTAAKEANCTLHILSLLILAILDCPTVSFLTMCLCRANLANKEIIPITNLKNLTVWM